MLAALHPRRGGVPPKRFARRRGAIRRGEDAVEGGYELLHLGAMGGYCSVVRPIIAVYPEGVLRADASGRAARRGEGGRVRRVPRADARAARRGDPSAARAARAASGGRPARGDAYESGDDAPLDDAAAAASEELPDAADAMEDDEEGEPVVVVDRVHHRLVHLPHVDAAHRTRRRRRRERRRQRRRGGDRKLLDGEGQIYPLRLEPRERKLLRLLEGLLHVSSTPTASTRRSTLPAKRRAAILREVHATLSGLLLACNYEAGQEAAAENSHADYAEFFETIFEVSRRYKILNPEKLRDVYGKLVYLLQDASEVADDVGFSVVVPVRTVHAKLAETGALALLQDPLVGVATQTIKPGPQVASRSKEIKAKEGCDRDAARRYANRSAGRGAAAVPLDRRQPGVPLPGARPRRSDARPAPRPL